jgi:hypothetical protein
MEQQVVLRLASNVHGCDFWLIARYNTLRHVDKDDLRPDQLPHDEDPFSFSGAPVYSQCY